ncbi:hypothetical protein DRH29_03185 [candidate division Kazan bacterium]|uniref:Cell division protein FtsX n=1 Tax=candidate division Kazan bacterium TaxID=2202143 RepID=A0A420ZCF7_UNCK3|nr:MAG: hypothetical protein DRH29_03185 [candidate division Kazan bacterium]
MFVSFNRILRSAFSSFLRNGWLSFVTIFIMTQALLIISIFASLNVVISTSIEAVNERIDVAVFFKDTAQEDSILSLKSQTESLEGVREVIYTSPQEALEIFLEDNRNRSIIRDVISSEENFLPASLEIKVTDPYLIEEIVEQVQEMDSDHLISETSLEDNQKIIERLRNLGGFIQNSSLLLALVFLIIAVLIIFNTIRITIFTRREEIEVMKLVGATDWYIRWPFIFEGIFYGLVATVLSSLLLVAGYLTLIKPMVDSYVISTSGNPVFSAGFWTFILLLQLIIAVSVGTISSYLATRRHLSV